jgi:hypothetical protein
MHHKRSDRGRPSNHFDLIKQKGKANVSKWHSYEQDKPMHVPSDSIVNDVRSPSSLGIAPVSILSAAQIEWQGKMSKASVTFIPTRQTNPRTEFQYTQRRQFSEFARNGTRELTIIWWNRMTRKCEQAWHSYEQGKPIHVQRSRYANDASSPNSVGMEPMSWL